MATYCSNITPFFPFTQMFVTLQIQIHWFIASCGSLIPSAVTLVFQSITEHLPAVGFLPMVQARVSVPVRAQNTFENYLIHKPRVFTSLLKIF